MLFFDLELLEYKTRKNSQAIVKAIDCLYTRKVYDTGYIPNLKNGNSYLLNPSAIVECKLEPIYKAQYIRLAGRRNFMDYKLLGYKWLNLALYPDIKINVIKRNPLLKVDGSKLNFIYEEEIN